MADSDGEVVRALDLGDGYLTEAEEVLWTVTDEVSERAADLTGELWRLQHRLRDLRETIDA